MKLAKQLTAWFLRPRTLALFIMFVMLLLILSACLQRPQTQIIHTLGTSTQHVDVLWFRQEIFTQTTDNSGEVIFVMPISRDSLMAIDIRDGTTIWNTKLPIERGGGARKILANQNTVFVATSIYMDAYDKTTGDLKWSTKLGDGHVSVIPQLDSDLLRVYYGDRLIEIDPNDGEIVTETPKNEIVWMFGNMILQSTPASQINALDKQSGEILWTNPRSFHLDEGQEPLDIGNGRQLVGFVNGTCELDLQTGEYPWCLPEINISNITVDPQSQLGFAMRDDLILLTIDLQTGDVLGETSFLSSAPVDKQEGFLASITFSNGIIIISFSDSGQTFGLEFNFK